MKKINVLLYIILGTLSHTSYAMIPMKQWPGHCKNLWCPEQGSPISTDELLANNIFWKNLSEKNDQELKNKHLVEALDLPGGDLLYPQQRKVFACALAAGANPNISTILNGNITCDAALKNDYYLVLHALQCGASPNYYKYEEPPLFHATTKTMAQLLLNYNADPFAKDNNDNSNLLHNAVIHGYFELISYYIRLSIDINAQAQNGKTPLMASINYLGHLTTSYKIIKVLLAHGANPYIPNKENETFLDELNKSDCTSKQVQKIQNITEHHKKLMQTFSRLRLFAHHLKH